MTDDFITQNVASYTHEYSNFPYNLIEIHNFKDADDSVASLINEINDYKNRGLYELAEKKAKENMDLLKPLIINAEWFRTIEEEVRNGQVMTLQKSQTIYCQKSQPEICCIDDIWIGD